MFDFLGATEYLKEYPKRCLEDHDVKTVTQAGSVYLNHIRTHSQLQNYVNDVSFLVETLAGYYHKVLIDFYRTSDSRESLVEDESTANKAIDQSPEEYEEFVSIILECLITLCAETQDVAADEISMDCKNRRLIVRKAVHETVLAQISESFVRRGVSGAGDRLRADCVEKCAILARVLGSLDNEYWLKVARISCECIESGRIRKCGIAALGVLCQNKLKLGAKTAAVKLSHELILCLSALIDVFHDSEEFQEAATVMNARFALSALLQLLADEDRDPSDSVNWTNLLSQLLDCRFTTDDEDDMYAGLCFLNLLHMSASSEFMTYVMASGLVMRALPLVVKAEHRSLRVRVEATTFLMSCADFPSLRESLIKSECVDLMSPMVTTDVKTSDLELQAAVLAVLAKLQLHDKTMKELLLDTIPFWDIFNDLVSKVTVKIEAKHAEVPRICNLLVTVLSSLSFNAEFKAKVLNKTIEEVQQVESSYEGPEGGDGGNKEFPLVKSDTKLAELVNMLCESESDESTALLNHLNLLSEHCEETNGRFHIVLTMFNMLRSANETRPIRKSKNAPDFDDEQIKQLQMLYEKLPETAKVKERLQYNCGGLVISSAVRRMFLQSQKLLPLLVKLTYDSNRCPKSLILLAAQAVRCLASLLDLRPQLICQRGLNILIRQLEIDPDDYQTKFTLASLVATIRPESFSYATRMSCTHHLLSLIQNATEELYVNFAARALVNLTSAFDDVAIRVFDAGKGWQQLEALMTEWSDATSIYASEILCNICAQTQVQTQIADLIEARRMPWTFALLFAYAAEDTVPARQLGCLAVLYYITSVKPTAIWIASGEAELVFSDEKVRASDRLTEILFHCCATHNGNAQSRVLAALCNLFDFALDEADCDKPGLMGFTQKFILTIGLVWNQLEMGAKERIRSYIHSRQFMPKPLSLLKELVKKCPDPEMQRLWMSFLTKKA